MLRKLFSALAIFAILGLVYFVFLLYQTKNCTITFLARPYDVANDNDTISEMIKERVQQLWELRTETHKENQMEMEMEMQTQTQASTSTKTTLGPCPDFPPDLRGPLHVEFDFKRTLDEARKAVSSPLQEGGRYKPPDCISRQKVAIIIPFRNRHEHLKHWLYYLHPILIRQQLDYGVYVINQDGEGVFNRAKLMNVGYREALKEYDYECFVFSDVDLVPMDDRNLYRCFDNPRHLAVAMDKFNFGLPYHSFFGGVSSLSKDQFSKINGFPNTYWGWGGEDDDLYNRVIHRGMSISRPDMVIGKYKMIKHERDLHNEANPQNPGKLHHTQENMDTDGLNTLNYIVKETVKDILFTFITVNIDAPPS